MPIPDVVNLISSLQLDSETINSWKVGVERALKKFIKDGTQAKPGVECPECNHTDTLIYQDGCVVCSNCGYSKCG
jgi:ribonucleoside-diphosphate reductase alpha chain